MIELQKHGRRGLQLILGAPLDVMTLLSIPGHLRKTTMIVCGVGRATSEEIVQQTRRARAAESAYLNQLVTVGRRVHFYVGGENQGCWSWAR